MSRHALVTACLALLATTAGCTGFLGGTTPTPAQSPSGPEVAPGVPPVETDGTTVTVATDRLLAANDRIRANTSYTLDRTVTISTTDGNGSLTLARTVRAAPNGTFERLSVDHRDPFTVVIQNGTRWTDATGTWTRTLLSNGHTTSGERLAGELDPYGYGDELPASVLTADTYRVREAADGVLLQPSSLDVASEPLTPLSTGAPTDERAQIFVGADGLVRSITLRYDTVYRSKPVSVSIRHEIVDVGSTTAERPGWVSTDR